MFLSLDPEVEEIGDRSATLCDNIRHNFHIDLSRHEDIAVFDKVCEPGLHL